MKDKKKTDRQLSEKHEHEFIRSLSLITEQLNDAILTTNLNNEITYANEAFHKLYGYSQDEIAGQTPDFLNAEPLSEQIQHDIYETVASGKIWRGEIINRRKDGSTFDCELVTFPLTDEQGNIFAYAGNQRDISERNKAIKALHDSEDRYRTLFSNNPYGIQEIDTSGIIRYANKAHIDMYGYEEGELIGKSISDFLVPGPQLDELPGYLAMLVKDQPLPVPYYQKVITKQGMERDFEVAWNYLRDTAGDVRGFISVLTDITERKKDQEALIKSEEKFRSLSENSTDYIMRYDNQFRHLYVNEACARVAGIPSTEFIGKTHREMGFDKEQCNIWEEKIQKVFETGEVQQHEFEFEGAVGRVYLDWRVMPEFSQTGKVESVLGVSRNVTESKLAAEALKESEETLRLSQETAEIGSWTWDISSNQLYWTDKVYRMFGFDPAKQPLYGEFINCVHPLDKEHVIKAIEKSVNEKEGYDIEYRIIRSDDKTERTIHAKGKALYDEKGEATRMMGIVHDITKRKRVEEVILKSDKIESIGLLAGGIAHDFNNFLTAILNNLYIVKMLTKSDEKIQGRIESAEKASMRAQSLTQQFLTFSKGGEPIKQLVNIRDIINESASLSLRGSNIQCESCMVDTLWHVEVDAGQMSQVFSNIIINANQSMSEGGTISLDCENVTVEAETYLPLEKGDYVKVSIKDQGIGISEEHVSKIFDPYYTTKEMGSGLGLTTAYSIVKRHGGHIEVESTVGLGTAFHIYLPASKEKAPENKFPKTQPITGDGKILIMDDDELVRDSLGQILESLGYRPEFAIDGKETAEAYRNALASGQPFDVVIMDLTIPGGEGGRETIGKLKTLNPNVKAIVSSGYSHDPVMSHYRDYGFKAVLSKPYKDIRELSYVINKVIKGT